MSVPGKEWRMHSLGQNRHVALHMVWHKHLFPCGFQTFTRNTGMTQMDRLSGYIEDPQGLHWQMSSV